MDHDVKKQCVENISHSIHIKKLTNSEVVKCNSKKIDQIVNQSPDGKKAFKRDKNATALSQNDNNKRQTTNEEIIENFRVEVIKRKKKKRRTSLYFSNNRMSNLQICLQKNNINTDVVHNDRLCKQDQIISEKKDTKDDKN